MRIPESAAGLALTALGLSVCLSACNPRHAEVGPSAAADPSAMVIGVKPADPTGDPPGTTPVDPGTTDVSKNVEQKAMPLPGQPNDHSNEAQQPSQKSQTSDINANAPTPESANSGNSAQKVPPQ